ncbi:hypothetical protein HMPREF1862_01317 [Varibaculum cambriense]|uniref:Uncharacterized protein n=1 Tax=Varibaculum cambriense TaxID=184870 RepID=A0AB34WYP6_9ACTO|nr:hypothetical protein HMPREF1862_01317 [Varibaculum cambriense]
MPVATLGTEFLRYRPKQSDSPRETIAGGICFSFKILLVSY